ncbi:MAG: elongation factor P maturation arginine rhamnosyltransferase EarP [Motiliproteus sp.]
MRPTWDIFCRVIDNYGDIGVTWRLARQLVAEHDQAVRLWVDDPRAFCRLCPQANSQDAMQIHQGVAVHQWPSEWQPVSTADVVIEAFGCELPDAYVDAMAQCTRSSLWLNLEYLSAETWVDGCHGLPSLQPQGLHKFFFFPGFTPRTGGLLRENELIAQRQRFQQDPAARVAFLKRLGVTPEPNARLISLFAYENTALASWLEALANSTQPVQLLVPEGRIIADLARWLGLNALTAGDLHRRHALTVQVLPFVSQDDYDRLLWSCDFNAVRGEDSFVRAQWAGRPLLWQLYPQQQEAHLDKLDAFLARYGKGLSVTTNAALQAQWQAWNRGEDMQASWQALQHAWPELSAEAENWCQQQAKQTNIAAALVQFYLNWL